MVLEWELAFEPGNFGRLTRNAHILYHGKLLMILTTLPQTKFCYFVQLPYLVQGDVFEVLMCASVCTSHLTVL